MADCSGSVGTNNVNIQKQSSAVQSVDSADEDKTDKVMEPILLEEFKFNEEPRSLLNLLEFLEKNMANVDQNDILAGLVYILMLEKGFVPSENKEGCEDYNFHYQRVLKFSKQLPGNWKRHNLYTFSFVLPRFSSNECIVACVMVGDDFLVNCFVKGIEDGQFNTMLDPLTYVISSSTNVRSSGFQNLDCLSWLVKKDVCHPAKQAILAQNGMIANCLEELPPEILLLIMSTLNIQDLVHLGQTNSFFYNLMRTPRLWLDRLRMDFKMTILNRDYTSLRNCYKHNFEVKKFQEKMVRKGNFFPLSVAILQLKSYAEKL